jgi:flavin reductase (DIM6/NTAB) family NADH-FMN oxidoreductase RutF
VDRSSPLYDAFAVTSHYAVHVLDESQQSLSRQFSDDNIDKFKGIKSSRGINDLPLLDHCIALLQCEVAARHEAGDHLILIGQVHDIQDRSGDPLLFYSGRYRELARADC